MESITASSPSRTTPISLADVTAAFHAPPPAYVDVGHSRLAHWKFGRGPDVVFVHGWPLHSATFRAIVPHLASSYTCHLLDLPGAGRTESDDDAPIDLLGHVRTLRHAIDRLGLDRYALVAHDSGGFIARGVAADDRRVTGLVLGNTEIPGHNPWLVVMYALLVRMPGGGTLLSDLMKSRSIRRSFLGFGGCFHDRALLDGDFHRFFVEPLVSSPLRSRQTMKLLSSVSARALESLRDYHARMKAPARLVWGVGDPFFPLEKARRMLPQFGGGADLVVLEKSKLFAHEERPEEFAAHASEFLRRVFPSTRA